MSDQLLSDHTARETALDCNVSFIVQAPAGSGKTALLTRRFLRLLARVKSPESVLAITFTRKAAAEMRGRIVDALSQAATGERPSDAFESEVFDDALAALKQDQSEGWRLLDMPMRLQIMTVDSLNARLVRSMPVSASMGAVSIADDQQLETLYADAADALLDWLTESGQLSDDVKEFFAHVDGDSGRWRTQLASLLRFRERWLRTVLQCLTEDPATLRARSESQLRALVDRRVSALDALLPEHIKPQLLALCRGAESRLIASGKLEGEHRLSTEWPRPTSDEALVFWQYMGSSFCLKKDVIGSFYSRVTVTHGFGPDHKSDRDEMIELLKRLSSIDKLAAFWRDVVSLPQPVYTDERWALITTMLRLLRLAAAELQRLMNQTGVVDYSALAAQALDALQDSATGNVTNLALRLDYAIEHVLVDEMQDTSAAQYDLLERLIDGWQPDDGRTLFCVGDPMQSIYRFRGAVVSRFLQTWDQGIGDLSLQRLTLTTNFRSDKNIVQWVNENFPSIMGSSADAFMDQVAYSPSGPKPSASDAGRIDWHLSDSTGFDEAERVREIVEQLRHDYPGDSIAILGRSRPPLEPILEELTRSGVAFDAVEMQRLTERPEVTDLLCLTRAFEHLADRVSWVGLMRSPLIGLSFDEIDHLLAIEVEGSHDISLLDRIRLATSMASFSTQSRQLLARLIQVYDDARQQSASQSLRERIETAYCRLGGPAMLGDPDALANAWQYLEILESISSDGQLEKLGDLDELFEKRRVSRVSDVTTVTAMTIFKSKGLEFDHVILPSLERGSRANAMPALFLELARRGNDATAVLFSMESAKAVDEKDALHQMFAEREQVRASNELDRLLYVASTRAKKTLHLVGQVGVSAKDQTIQTPKKGTLLNRLWPVAKQYVATSAEQIEQPTQAQVSWRQPIQRQVISVWRPPERSWQLASQASVSELEEEAVSFRWAGDNARHVGTVVHHWFQTLSGNSDPLSFVQNMQDVRQRHRMLLRLEGVPEDALDEAEQRVHDALINGVSGDVGRWLLSNKHADSAAELSLSGLIDGSVRHIVIDRVLRDKGGDLWIVDYKTSMHEGSDMDAFFANELRRYDDQLDVYAKIMANWYTSRGFDAGRIRRALYFPHYGVLREYE